MLTFSKEQLTAFDLVAFRNFLDRLCSRLREPPFDDAIRRIIESEGKLELIAQRLVERAESYGFEAEGEAIPFCLLAVYDGDDFKQHSSYEWVVDILSDINLSPESRMDAVFALLEEKVRLAVFGPGVEDY
jgi:hypothetical protein